MSCRASLFNVALWAAVAIYVLMGIAAFALDALIRRMTGWSFIGFYPFE